MGVDRPIDVTSDQRNTLLTLLKRHLPNTTAWAYGSRVKWTARPQSDLDLVVFIKPEQERRISELREAFEESNLPFRVDLFVWDAVPEQFRKQIEADHVVLVESKEAGVGSEWTRKLLGALTENFDALRVPIKQADRRLGPYPYYGASGIVENIDDYLFDGEYLLIAEDGENLRTRKTPIAFLASGKFWVNNHAHIVRGNHEANTRYLMYALSEMDISGYLTGSTMPKLTQGNMNRISLPTPPLPEQRAIAHILGTLDDKIELNRRMNETLEAMARALFKSWFIDFDPVRAKAALRNHSPSSGSDWTVERARAYLDNMDEEIAALFPDHLVDSELGPIPEGWGLGTLNDIAKSPKHSISPANVVEDTPYIGLEHMPRRSIALTEWEGSGKVASNKSLFNKGEFLFGKLRPYFHKVGIAPLDGICSTDIVVVTPKTPDWSVFTLACLSSDEFVNYTDKTSTGTKMPRTSWETMGDYPLCIPARHVAQAFQNIAQPHLDRIATNISQSRTLITLRDTLLPKLISGEIRTSNVSTGIIQEWQINK